jgi:hypothetical protein
MSTDLLRNPLVNEGRTLIDDLLGEQQLLTPVATFSRKHERHTLPAGDAKPLIVPLHRSSAMSLGSFSRRTGIQRCKSSRYASKRSRMNDAVSWLGTGQICTEELAYLGALAKFGMGVIHGDGNTRQCMATAATAYKQSFGFDAPPYT